MIDYMIVLVKPATKMIYVIFNIENTNLGGYIV